MQITTEIKLDIARNTSPPIIAAKQSDSGTRFVKVSLLENGAPYTIESNVTARIRVLKPDNTAVYNPATVSDNAVTAELTKQALAVSGTAVAEIGLYKSDNILTSFIFYINIVASAVSDAQIESSNEFHTLDEALNEVTSATSKANSAIIEARAATGIAYGAADAANSATERANTAAAAVGDVIDGVAIKDEDNDTTILAQFRIENGAPVIVCSEI